RGRSVGTEDFEIAPAAQVIVKGRAFKNGADLLQRAAAVRCYVVAADDNLAAREPNLAEHHADGGAFARAVMAEQAVDFARRDLQRQVVHGEALGETFLDVGEVDHAGGSIQCSVFSFQYSVFRIPYCVLRV